MASPVRPKQRLANNLGGSRCIGFECLLSENANAYFGHQQTVSTFTG
jgi:hypothetical protein